MNMKKVLMALAILTMGIGCFADEVNGHECVQLWENGPYWATKNLKGPKGSSSGDYYWWGSTLGYNWFYGPTRLDSTDAETTQKDVSFSTGNGYTKLTYAIDTSSEPNALLNAGYTYIPEGSDTQTLAPEHDAATQTLGPGWRIPTRTDFENLIANCTWSYGEVDGRSGITFTGKGDYVGKSVFFGDTDGCLKNQKNVDWTWAYYWTSTPDLRPNYGTYSQMFMFKLDSAANPKVSFVFRYYGMRIRPVYDMPPPPPPKGTKILIR